MRVVGLILRIYSWLFHLLLAGFLLAAAFLAWSSNAPLNLEFLLWKDAAVIYWVAGCGIAGVLFTLMSVRRILPVLFFAWSLVVVAVLVRGFFFSSYNFGPGGGSLSLALYLILAAVVAVLGSWLGLGRATGKRARAAA